MAMSMAPPQLPGFSLRVQLFAPNAYDSKDKPVRCFRVVTTPEVSIREFCEEASRIHEINYGTPLSVKKCQDDQEFDVTQSEIVGNLFANTATIRVVQASMVSSIRDSVPPTSALRFDPTGSIGRKRGREASVTANGSGSSTSWISHKRQRVAHDENPDEPLPSREHESEVGRSQSYHGQIPDINFVPNSQESVDLGTNTGYHSTLRHVRPTLLHIPETPSPSPPPELQNAAFYEEHPTDQQDRKPTTNNNTPSLLFQANHRHTRESSAHEQSRRKSASYHIERATEQGTSVSTAATSPLLGDFPQNVQSEEHLKSRRNVSDSGSLSESSSGRRNEVAKSRSPNEESIYDIIPEPSKASAILNAKKATLKLKSSPKSSLPGIEWSKNKFSTPTSNRRSSASRSEIAATTPGELPLTPKSKEREEKQRRRREAEDAKKAQSAAAQAAEQRKKEADEARVAEEMRVAEEERAKREEQERIEVENFRKGEAERAALVAKAARLQKEREERESREADEERKRIERKEEAKLERERINREKEKTKRLEREAAEAKEERVREKERNRAKKDATEAKKAKEEAEAAKRKSISPEQVRLSTSRSVTPGSTRRPQSSTPFIPTGRKSSLKSSILSSQAVASSPPPGHLLSPEMSASGVGIEAQMPLPKDKTRRVSFLEEEKPQRKETPIKPPSRTLPPPRTSTPKPVTAIPSALRSTSPKSTTPKPLGPNSIRNATVENTVPVEKQSRTPIPLPPSIARLSKDRSSTPVTTSQAQREEATPQATTKKLSPTAITQAKSLTPNQAPQKEKLKPVEPTVKKSSAEVSLESDLQSESNSESESESKPEKETTSRVSSSNPATDAVKRPAALRNNPIAEIEREEKSDEDDELADDDEEEVASDHSYDRDSRSPVVFSQHLRNTGTSKPERPQSPESASVSDDEELEDDTQDASDGSEVGEAPGEHLTKKAASSSEGQDAQVETFRSSPPTLPGPRRSDKSSGSKLNEEVNSKDTNTDESTCTQQELDQQLTSSMTEARPNAMSSTPVAAPPSSKVRPTLKYGASLQSLNSKKPVFGSSIASSGVKKLQVSQGPALQESSGSEEEESDNYSDSDSDSETAKRVASALSRNSEKKVPTPAKREKSDSSSDTDSDSDSDSDGESEEQEKTKLRDQLAAQIAGMGKIAR